MSMYSMRGMKLELSSRSFIKASSVDHRLHAEDTQLFISFSPNN